MDLPDLLLQHRIAHVAGRRWTGSAGIVGRGGDLSTWGDDRLGRDILRRLMHPQSPLTDVRGARGLEGSQRGAARIPRELCERRIGRADHWFWDRTKSGGIFIEHGVHFFDMFADWLGGGNGQSAGRVLRPGSGIEEQVYCTARYGHVPVSFYHGFTQAG